MYLDQHQANQLGLTTGLGNAGIIEVGTRNVYDANGYLVQVRDAKPGSSGEVYWQLASQTARGRASETWLAVNTAEGGGVTGPSMRVYDTHESETGRLTERRVIAEGTGNQVQHLTWAWDRLGNLIQRRDEVDNRTERFFYDAANRLDYSDNGAGGWVRDYVYAANGNLISKPEAGEVTYGTFEPFCAGVAGAVGPGPHAATKAGAVSHCYNAEGQRIRSSDQRELKYSVAGQVTEMIEAGTRTVIQYGADRQRYHSIEYSNQTSGIPLEQVIHLGDVEFLPSGKETRRYLPGGLVISHRRDGTGGRRWVLTDHQGSADRIVNRFGLMRKYGSVSERMSFEPFGWRRNEYGTSLSRTEVRTTASHTTRRGYTGHEHYDKRALIHMNGRVYDPEIGRLVNTVPASIVARSPSTGWSPA